MPITNKTILTCVAGLLLAGLSSNSLGGQISSSRTSQSSDGRIQLRAYTDHANKEVDPLTQIVRVYGGQSSGTATLLPNCRLITTLHVLIQMKTGMKRDKLLDKNESLVGERFEFETAPLPTLGNKKAISHFVVIGHGQLDRLNLEALLDEAYPANWAIGYDEQCLSEKLNLGVVRIAGVDDLELRTAGLFTAGYSTVTQPGTGAPSFPLYVDSRCGLNEEGFADALHLLKYLGTSLETNCSVSQGGAGQLLMRHVRIRRPAIDFESDGRRRIFAIGMFERASKKIVRNIPNVDHPWVVQPFFRPFFQKLKPFLEGQVNPAVLKDKLAAPPSPSGQPLR